MKISRRSFIKAVIIGSFAVVFPQLTACKTKEKVGGTITATELENYELAVLEINNHESPIFVTKAVDEEKKYYALKLNDNEIVKYVVYDYKQGKPKGYGKHGDYIDPFKEYLSITTIEPALISIEEVNGKKEEYTSDELKKVVNELKKDLNKEKVLTK